MAGPYSFRLVAGDEHQARFIAAHVRSMTPAPRVALLYVNDDYGQALYRVLREEIRRTDVTVVYETPYLKGARFTAAAELAAAVTAARPTLLLWLGTPPELAVILDEIREGLPDLRVLGSDGLSGAAGHAVLGRHLRDGDQFVSFFNPLNAGPEYDELADRFRSVADHTIGSEEALTYDAVMLVAEALRHGTATRLGVRNYLQSLGGDRTPYVGLSGPVSFDEHGDAKPSYVILELSGPGVKVVR
jgi:branched-chain amino acid transport system substrate-binding protein